MNTLKRVKFPPPDLTNPGDVKLLEKLKGEYLQSLLKKEKEEWLKDHILLFKRQKNAQSAEQSARQAPSQDISSLAPTTAATQVPDTPTRPISANLEWLERKFLILQALSCETLTLAAKIHSCVTDTIVPSLTTAQAAKIPGDIMPMLQKILKTVQETKPTNYITVCPGDSTLPFHTHNALEDYGKRIANDAESAFPGK